MKILIIPTLLILLILSSCKGLSEEAYEIPEINGPYIEWDDASRMRIAPVEGGSETLSYPRMEILSNGDYLLLYESVTKGSIYSMRSYDKGESWEDPRLIFARRNGINMAVPEIIQLKDGSILVAANLRPSQPYTDDRKFGISVKKAWITV